MRGKSHPSSMLSAREYNRYMRLVTLPSSGGFFLAGELRLRSTRLCGGMLNLGIDLAADEDGRPRQVEPEQKDNNGAERAIRHAVAVEIVEVEAKAEGDEQPQRDARERPRRNPVPLLMFEVGRVIVDERKGEEHEGEHDGPLQDVPCRLEGAAEVVTRRQPFAYLAAVEDERERRNRRRRQRHRQPQRDEP